MIENEKVKDYNEAVERAKKLYGNGIAEGIFPEPKESEDEKIIKWIIDDIRYNMDNEPLNNSKYKKEAEKAIAWLEKQGKKSTAKIEPRFKVGDWITFHGGNSFKILKIEAEINSILDYLLLDQNGYDSYFNKTYVDENARLWTIQDAKDGDIIHLGTVTAIFKKYIGSEKCICYCSFCKDGGFEIPIENGEDNVYGCYNATLATKEQRDLLFQKIKESGYEWDAEKKELKKLVKPKFDPKTLKPFDKVICKNGLDIWCCDFFSSYIESYVCKNVCISRSYLYCIPYNDETKHLVGTTDEAPEFYKYWE